MSNITNQQKYDCAFRILREMKIERAEVIKSGKSKTWVANQIHIMEAVVADYREAAEEDKHSMTPESRARTKAVVVGFPKPPNGGAAS